jgi:hypothetical protein
LITGGKLGAGCLLLQLQLQLQPLTAGYQQDAL